MGSHSKLKISKDDIKKIRINKKSIDARRKDSIYYVHDLDNYTVGEHNCISTTFDEIMKGGFGVQPESKEKETELMLAKAFKSFCKKIFKKDK